MDFRQIIEVKKQGRALSAAQIATLVNEFTADRLPRYQMSAFLMAVWFQGLDSSETIALTDAMLRSGSRLDLSGLSRPTADKHSTGGVGDKVSLLLAPLAAACGVQVPMLSGRGLGHTGGTLDKLEAVPGYQILLPKRKFLAIIEQVGCAIVGQSEDIAPADGKIYALRDVTGTVDCVPLITASILSKKLAAGPTTIVIDLKTGDGAFMADLESARLLARALQDTAAAWQRSLAVVFSNMSQPLGIAVGHATEAIEAFAALHPEGRRQAPLDLVTLTEALVAEMLLGAGLAQDLGGALAQVRSVWESGAAFARLLDWISAQGGRLDPERDDFGLDVAPRSAIVAAPCEGKVAAIACREIGFALADLGGARRRVEDSLDHSVGIDFQVKLGERVQAGQPLATLYAHDSERSAAAVARIQDAVSIADEAPPAPDLILDRLAPLPAE